MLAGSKLVILQPGRGRKLEATLALLPKIIQKNKINPVTRDLALGFIKERRVPEHDQLGEFRAITEGLKKLVRYTRDPRRFEYIQELPDLLDSGAGDCDDYTAALAGLFGAVGFPTRLKVVGRDRLSHIFPEALVNRQWIPADLARKDGFYNQKSYPIEKVIPITETESEENMSGLPFESVGGVPFDSNFGEDLPFEGGESLPFEDVEGVGLGVLPALAASAIPMAQKMISGGKITDKIAALFGGGKAKPKLTAKQAMMKKAKSKFKTGLAQEITVPAAVYQAVVSGAGPKKICAAAGAPEGKLKSVLGYTSSELVAANLAGKLRPDTGGGAGAVEAVAAAMAEQVAPGSSAELAPAAYQAEGGGMFGGISPMLLLAGAALAAILLLKK